MVVIENIFRHLEMGESPEVAAEKGGREVALPVLAATLTTVVVFFPVTLLYGVSKFLFSALALSVVISLFASYLVALTVVPLFCAKLIKKPLMRSVTVRGLEITRAAPSRPRAWTGLMRMTGTVGSAGALIGARFILWFNRRFEGFLNFYERRLNGRALDRPGVTIAALSRPVRYKPSPLYPRLGVAFFPRTEAGQFVINVKAPSGTRLEVTPGRSQKSRGHHPAGYRARGSGDHRVEPRHLTGHFGDIHQQLRAAHGLRAGQFERRREDGQL